MAVLEHLTPKQRYERRHSSLKDERSSWIPHYRDLADNLHPRRARFQRTDRNKGGKRNQKIINNTPTRALRILSSGMMAGITSPARQWFRLVTPDPQMMEHQPVRAWLHAVERRIMMTYARSNIYNALPNCYTDLGGFGIHCQLVEEDAEDVLRAYNYSVGSYVLAMDHTLRVNTMFRETTLTVIQLVERFGLENCSMQVQNCYMRGDYDRAIDVVQVVEPNRDMDPERAGPAGMPWASVWFEVGGESRDLLGTGGFNEFPLMAPRWAVTDEDTYGYCPGMDCLGDARALQHLERRKAMVIDKLVNPPMNAPGGMRTEKNSLLPGDTNFLPADATGQKFEPAYVIDARSMFIKDEIAQHELRINSTFFADLFLALLQQDRPQMTAREIEERHSEKMLQLGPVLERLQDELLDPLIDRTFGILNRNMMLPAAPQELQGQPLRVEYISILAQAQKLLGTVAVEKMTGYIQALSQTHPMAIDKFNADKAVDEMGELLGVSPDLIRADDEVAEMRAQREEEKRQMAAPEQAKGMRDAAAAAQTAGEVDQEAVRGIYDSMTGAA